MTIPRPPSIWTAGVEHMDGGRGTVGKSRPPTQRGRHFLPQRTALAPGEDGSFSHRGRLFLQERTALAPKEICPDGQSGWQGACPYIGCLKLTYGLGSRNPIEQKSH